MLAPYVNLKKAFNSLHCEALLDLLRLCAISAETVDLLSRLYSWTGSAEKCVCLEEGKRGERIELLSREQRSETGLCTCLVTF